MDMNALLKRCALILITIAATIVIGYAAFKLYNAAIADATQKIRSGVSAGISDGVGNSLNPFKAIGNIFGGRRSN